MSAKPVSRRSFIARFGLLALAANLPGALAQTPCCRKAIIGAPPGSLTDTIARTVIQFLKGIVGQDIAAENRAAALGVQAALEVASTPPDGNTILFSSNETLYVSPGGLGSRIDMQKDLVAVSLIARTPLALVVPAGSGVANLKEFLAVGKSRKLPFAATRIGTTRLATEQFFQAARISGEVVPYQGAAAALNAVLAGETSAAFIPFPLAEQQSASGKVRILGVTSQAASPDWPRFAQHGLGAVDADQWVGVFAPKGTPQKVVDDIAKALREVAGRGEFRTQMAKLRVTPDVRDAKAFAGIVQLETQRWAKIAKEAGIKD